MAGIWRLLKPTINEWLEDKAPRLGAALAFYSVLSMAPLLVIVLAVAGAIFGEDATRGEIVGQIDGLVGLEGAKAVQDLIAHAQRPREGILATAIGSIVLLLGASGVFGELQDSLNTVWGVRPKPGRGLLGIVRDRFFSFAMVLGTAFLLMVSLLVSTALATAGKFFAGFFPVSEVILPAIGSSVSFLVFTVLFALIFKLVPDARIAWNDVWIGAVLTALLFLGGKYLVSLYLGRSGVTSAYGAAGSLIALVLWIYYSAQILFFGAELTQVYASSHGREIVPGDHAESVIREIRAKSGVVRSTTVGMPDRDSKNRTWTQVGVEPGSFPTIPSTIAASALVAIAAWLWLCRRHAGLAMLREVARPTEARRFDDRFLGVVRSPAYGIGRVLVSRLIRALSNTRPRRYGQDLDRRVKRP